jgi:hypothetical protein
LIALLGIPSQTRAEQPRDYMLRLQPAGTFALLDYFGTGIQATLQHSLNVYGNLNSVQTRAFTTLMYPLGDVGIGIDIRLLMLRIGGDIGVRSVWRDLAFAPGEPTDRVTRGKRDVFLAGNTTSDTYPFAEGRAELLLPFNRYVLATTQGAVRYEGTHPTSFDWIWAYVHDGGVIPRWEMQLWFHHPDWGGIGPYVETLSLPRDGARSLGWSAGFTAVTRAGILTRRNDLIYFSFRIRPGDNEFGQQSLHAPVRGILLYRLALEL